MVRRGSWMRWKATRCLGERRSLRRVKAGYDGGFLRNRGHSKRSDISEMWASGWAKTIHFTWIPPGNADGVRIPFTQAIQSTHLVALPGCGGRSTLITIQTSLHWDLGAWRPSHHAARWRAALITSSASIHVAARSRPQRALGSSTQQERE